MTASSRGKGVSTKRGPLPDVGARVPADLLKELAETKARLQEAEEHLRAIRKGEVDALFIDNQVYILQGAETPYRILVESINEGAATLLQDGTILYCNRRLGAMLNEPLQQLIGSSLPRFLSPSDHASFAALVQSGLRGTCKGEFLVERPGRQPLPLQLTLGPLDVEGTQAVCMVATDLTDRKRAEEARFVSTLASIGDAVVATDLAGRITFVNHAALGLTGWGQEEAMGRPVVEVLEFLSEGDAFDPAKIMEAVISGGDTATIPADVLLVRKDGSAVPVDGSIAPIFHATGKAMGAVFALRDITEYRALEAALSNALGEATVRRRSLEVLKEDLEKTVQSMEILVSTTIDSKILVDGDGTIVCTSPRAAAALATTPHEMKGVHCTSFLLEEEYLGARLALSDFINNPGSPMTATLRLRTRAGELVWFSLKVSRVSLGPAGGFLVDVERVSA